MRRRIDVTELPRDEQVTYGRDVVMRQLAMMDRSRAQLADALARRDVPEAVAEEVLQYFEEIGLIDDAHFAEVLTRTRFAGKGASRRAILMELKRKGVSGDIAQAAIEHIDPDAELDAAIRLAEKKLRTGGGNPATLHQRAYAMLARRGFSPAQCSRALAEARKRVDQSTESDEYDLLD